jgi:hypothetical protein
MTYYIAPSNRITERDLAGEANTFADLADAREAARSMNMTNPDDGADGEWVVVGPNLGGGVTVIGD